MGRDAIDKRPSESVHYSPRRGGFIRLNAIDIAERHPNAVGPKTQQR